MNREQFTPENIHGPKQSLETSFIELFEASANETVTKDVFEVVASRYEEPHRHYHTLEHIQNLLALEKSGLLHVHDSEVVRAAIWFHDVIYNQQVSNHDNEFDSAAFATTSLNALGREDLIDDVHELIYATINHQLSAGCHKDTAAFLDMDLSILGAKDHIYDKYAQNIRREYDYVPFEDYRMERVSILMTFRSRLAENDLFFTAEAHDLFAENAYDNLTREIEMLSK